MKAYHFQQIAQGFAKAYLRFVDNDAQKVVNILNEDGDVLSVEPTLGSESFIFEQEQEQDKVFLKDVGTLAHYFARKEDQSEKFLTTMKQFLFDGDSLSPRIDCPEVGTVAVTSTRELQHS